MPAKMLPLPAKILPSAEASKWVKQALLECASIKADFQRVKLRALKAGYFFLQARSAVKDGDFLNVLACHGEQISPTTVYRYITFTEEALQWAAKENPGVRNAEELLKLAGLMVMQSPKGFIALMRQLGEMRKFGEYEEIKYKLKKLGAGATQLDLDFSKAVCPLFDLLDQLDQPNFNLILPDGTTPADAWRDLKARCERIAAKADAQLKDATDI